jgi:acrylyl-CoA reductase (NADPH)
MPTSDLFTAIVIEDHDGKPRAGFKQIGLGDLPDHDVLVEVAYSTLNYKDGLAVSGRGRIARRMPMIAGADLAGTVVESRSDAWRSGDQVIVNGWGMSETQQGGYTRYQRVKPEWLTRLPAAFSLEQAMAVGTAGYTAALSLDALERLGVTPQSGEVLVTGAAGGLGSVALVLLKAAGFRPVASTGRATASDYLLSLGAESVIERQSLETAAAPLQKERWGGAIDSVGSATLAAALAQTRAGGVVISCGLAGGAAFPGSVMPFILRGVSLVGIESVMAPAAMREAAWARLSRDLSPEALSRIYRVEPMSNLPALAEQIMDGAVLGRVVVDVTK